MSDKDIKNRMDERASKLANKESIYTDVFPPLIKNAKSTGEEIKYTMLINKNYHKYLKTLAIEKEISVKELIIKSLEKSFT